MLISSGLVKSVDYQPTKDDEFEEKKSERHNGRGTVETLLEYSPPKRLLSDKLRESDKDHQPAPAEPDAKSAGGRGKAPAPSAAMPPPVQSNLGRPPMLGDVGRAVSISQFFKKQNILRMSQGHEKTSSLSTALESGAAGATSSGPSPHAPGTKIKVLVEAEEPPTHIPVTKTTTVGDVVDHVVKLAMLDAKRGWQLLLVDEDGEVEEDLPLDKATQIMRLGTSFFLAPPPGGAGQSEGSGSAGTASGESDSKNRDADVTSDYSEYRVTKTNERGKRQSRILGIDGQCLYNKKSSGSSGISAGVWRKQRQLEDVSSIVREPGRGSAAFTIVFRNGTSRKYECESEAQLEEIVRKITVLKQRLDDR